MGTVTKKIGSSGAGRDYSLMQSWEDALPANLILDLNDQVGEIYNDSEFVVATPLVISGQTTSATYGITLRCATGQSWRDNANKLTNRMAYNAANGVAIRATGSYGIAITVSTDNVAIDGIQLKATGAPNRALRMQNAGCVIRNSILQAKPSNSANEYCVQLENGAKIINSTVIVDTANIAIGVLLSTASVAVNTTIVRPSNYTAGGMPVKSSYGIAIARNCALFGFTTTPTGTFAADGHNVTDMAAAPGSTSNLVSKTFSSQFVQTSNAGSVEDYRVLSTADLVAAGVRDAANTGDVDALGQARSLTTPTVGAMEYVAAGGGGSTGTMSATEAGDTLASSGAVLIDGTLARTEGADTVTASGSVMSVIGGTLAVVEGSDSGAAVGSVLVGGVMAATEGADTLAAAGSPIVEGLMTATEAPDTLAASVALPAVILDGGGAGDWRSVRELADRLDHAERAPKPSKAAKKLRRKQIEAEVLELLPDAPESILIAPQIAQAVYRREAASVASGARWTPPVALLPVAPSKPAAVEQAALIEAEAQKAQFDASEAIRAMIAEWQQNEQMQRDLEDEQDIEMLLLD